MIDKEVKYIRLNGEAVSGILEGRKTQMRFALKKQDILGGTMTAAGLLAEVPESLNIEGEVIKPPYEIGDVIGVKETWAELDGEYVYKVDDAMPAGWHLIAWKSSVHMPKEAVRLYLKVANIRFEKLHDISMLDIAHEGVWLSGTLFPEVTFAEMWDGALSETKREKYGWSKNPFVWVVTFERMEGLDG